MWLASVANAALCVRALISSAYTCVSTTHQLYLYHVHRVSYRPIGCAHLLHASMYVRRLVYPTQPKVQGQPSNGCR